MRVKEGPWSSTSESNVTWKKKSGSGGVRRRKEKWNGEEEGDRKKIGLLKKRDYLQSFDFLAGFGNSMTLTYRENECFSLFLP